MLRAYFNHIYNRIYDITVTPFASYQKLQKRCISKLNFSHEDKILCVGVGTGNEIVHILEANSDVNIVGIDFSSVALEKVQKKASAFGKRVKTSVMDAQNLEFESESFDKVVCIHLMDFVDNNEGATYQIFRVLKKGGQFVITYPSSTEGAMLGLNLLKDNMINKTNTTTGRAITLVKSLIRMLIGVLYIPLLFRSKQKPYIRDELELIITRLAAVDLQIEEDPIYQDFIVYGRKLAKRRY